MDRAFFALLSTLARTVIAAEMAHGLTVDDKGGAAFDPVTEADRAGERALRGAIEAAYPDHGICGEEYGLVRGEAAIRWSLDPVDGTRALLCGLPSWAVLVGLLEGGRHVAGMIDLPALDETLIGIDGETCRNGAPVRTSGCATVAEARLSTTDPNLFTGGEAEAFDRVRRAARLTRFGLDALGYARVATGDLDLVIESGLKPHDYDALVAVVRSAGGTIGNWRGGDDLGGGDVVAAASQGLYDEAVALLGA
ncbi:MAG: histidinol-phosphatase [Pseudomonadota bacterium]|nr:histidinol-phosphatase [Pseudomonadota bacterium]